MVDAASVEHHTVQSQEGSGVVAQGGTDHHMPPAGAAAGEVPQKRKQASEVDGEAPLAKRVTTVNQCDSATQDNESDRPPKARPPKAAAKAGGTGGAPRPESDCHAALTKALNARPELKGLHFTCRPTAFALTMVVRVQISTLTDGKAEYLYAPAVRDPSSAQWQCEELLEGLRALRTSRDALDNHPGWQVAIGKTTQQAEYKPTGGLPPRQGSAGAPEQYSPVAAAKKRISKPAATRGAEKEQREREGKGGGRKRKKEQLDGSGSGSAVGGSGAAASTGAVGPGNLAALLQQHSHDTPHRDDTTAPTAAAEDMRGAANGEHHTGEEGEGGRAAVQEGADHPMPPADVTPQKRKKTPEDAGGSDFAHNRKQKHRKSAKHTAGPSSHAGGGGGSAPLHVKECSNAVKARNETKGLKVTCHPIPGTNEAVTVTVTVSADGLSDGRARYISATASRDPSSGQWRFDKLLEGLRALTTSPDRLDLPNSDTSASGAAAPMGAGGPPMPDPEDVVADCRQKLVKKVAAKGTPRLLKRYADDAELEIADDVNDNVPAVRVVIAALGVDVIVSKGRRRWWNWVPLTDAVDAVQLAMLQQTAAMAQLHGGSPAAQPQPPPPPSPQHQHQHQHEQPPPMAAPPTPAAAAPPQPFKMEAKQDEETVKSETVKGEHAASAPGLPPRARRRGQFLPQWDGQIRISPGENGSSSDRPIVFDDDGDGFQASVQESREGTGGGGGEVAPAANAQTGELVQIETDIISSSPSLSGRGGGGGDGERHASGSGGDCNQVGQSAGGDREEGVPADTANNGVGVAASSGERAGGGSGAAAAEKGAATASDDSKGDKKGAGRSQGPPQHPPPHYPHYWPPPHPYWPYGTYPHAQYPAPQQGPCPYGLPPYAPPPPMPHNQPAADVKNEGSDKPGVPSVQAGSGVQQGHQGGPPSGVSAAQHGPKKLEELSHADVLALLEQQEGILKANPDLWQHVKDQEGVTGASLALMLEEKTPANDASVQNFGGKLSRQEVCAIKIWLLKKMKNTDQIFVPTPHPQPTATPAALDRQTDT
ncbi:unnamed protein product [Vitrella brassicaformis CCMP3155]|uniref:Uncharacterized protein n=1 Tax=Vitrella brassicaformis (strain CCMP3155) TaxID=1169540 RepID=A0A0G4F805_VITBC|nr:unnamed protein product [Vitrella brassicaformis CCMP3155]|eukprot:CEM08104.1 unnamed protein product [Vitrella brassicaformis CCMP3155]